MRITKKEIRQMVPEEDYERGLAYYETGAYRRCVPAPALQTGTAASIWWRRF